METTREVKEIKTGMSDKELVEYIYGHVYPKIEAASVMSLREQEDYYCKEWSGFTLTYYIDVDELLNKAGETLPDRNNWTRTARVNKSIFDQLGLDIARLEKSAIRNVENVYRIVGMQQMLAEAIGMPVEEMPPEPEPSMQMIVLTNKSGVYGAAALMSEKAIEDIKQVLGAEEFVILPSSIHEVIAVPYCGSMSDMTHMVQEVNEGQVAVEERLADNAFLYKDGKIMTAA